MLTPGELAEITAQAESAKDWPYNGPILHDLCLFDVSERPLSENVNQFITHARNDVRKLAAEVERLTKLLQELLTAALVIQDDLILRSEIEYAFKGGERGLVACGYGVWKTLCKAIDRAVDQGVDKGNVGSFRGKEDIDIPELARDKKRLDWLQEYTGRVVVDENLVLSKAFWAIPSDGTIGGIREAIDAFLEPGE